MVFEGFRRPLEALGGPRRLPRGSRRSPEVFDFSSIFDFRRGMDRKISSFRQRMCQECACAYSMYIYLGIFFVCGVATNVPHV